MFPTVKLKTLHQGTGFTGIIFVYNLYYFISNIFLSDKLCLQWKSTFQTKIWTLNNKAWKSYSFESPTPPSREQAPPLVAAAPSQSVSPGSSGFQSRSGPLPLGLLLVLLWHNYVEMYRFLKGTVCSTHKKGSILTRLILILTLTWNLLLDLRDLHFAPPKIVIWYGNSHSEC